jgi:hypothetical protein
MRLADEEAILRGTSRREEVNGWGADLDPANRPAVPKEAPSDVTTVRGRVGERQQPLVKIHQSIEHPDLTPVFGTACPPRGLSGRMRDVAYQFGEGRLARWMTLMLADRVDVIEGLLEDARNAQIPNVVRERGLGAVSRNERERDRMIAAGAGLAVLGIAAVMITMGLSRRQR